MPPARLLLLASLVAAASGCRDRVTEWTSPFAVSATAEVPLAVTIGEWCAIRDDGRVVCWPEHDPGAAAVAVDGTAIAVAVGCDFACAIRPDRSVACWQNGPNTFFTSGGQLDVPADLGPVRALGASCSRACASRVDGSVRCWGDTRAPPAGLEPMAGLEVEDDSACAIAATGGRVHCWREDGTAVFHPVAGSVPVLDVSTSGAHWCALRADGTGACWGQGEVGQAGVPAGLGRLVSLDAGLNSTCGLDAEGQLACHGFLMDHLSLPGATLARAGMFQVCVVQADRKIRCWNHPYM